MGKTFSVTQVAPLNAQIQAAMDGGVLVVLFPEGTSSDGRDVLPFKSSLLEPGTNTAHALAASHLGYALEDGDVAEEICYWKDMTFVPHLLNLLGKSRIQVSLRFSQVTQHSGQRKELARHLRSEVLRLKSTFHRFHHPFRKPCGLPCANRSQT